MTLIQLLYANTRHELSAVTAACLMIKTDRFEKINGFDDRFRVTYNDVDLCLKLTEKGYRNIYNPNVELIHYESVSVGLPNESGKTKKGVNRDLEELNKTTKLLQSKWQKYIKHDPQLNSNIDRKNAYIEPLILGE